MARSGFEILDSDMHVFEPHDLYLEYANPNGETGFAAENRKKHREIKFMFGDGRPLRRFPVAGCGKHFCTIENLSESSGRKIWDNCARLYDVA